MKKCLTDPDATVRLRAGQGLLAAKENDGIAALIALLTGTPLNVAWQAEELLRFVAGKSSPAALVGNGDEKERTACGESWAKWWTDNQTKLDLTEPEREHRRPRLILLIDAKTPRYWMIGGDGTTRWDERASDSLEKILASLFRVESRGWMTVGFEQRWREGRIDQEMRDEVSKRYGWPFGDDYVYQVRNGFLVADGDRVTELDGVRRVQWFALADGPIQRVNECLGLIQLGFHAPPPEGLRPRCVGILSPSLLGKPVAYKPRKSPFLV